MSERTVFQSVPHRHVVSLPPQASVWEAACVMQGILTERDLMTRVLAKALNAKKTPVSEMMTPHPQCVVPEMTVSDAVLILLERGFRHFPMVSSAGRILGVFSIRDALPREIDSAVSLAEFRDSVNDALGRPFDPSTLRQAQDRPSSGQAKLRTGQAQGERNEARRTARVLSAAFS